MKRGNQIRAIVFDANVFGRDVEPNIFTIKKWAEACERHEAELWIPEVVAWELAQRTVRESERIAREIQAHNRRQQKWGVPAIAEPSPINVAKVISCMTTAGAVMVPLGGEEAVLAIQDQVLLRGPASRKKEVKTGAADSAWVRSVIEYNGGDGSDIILVTGDVDAVVGTCDSLEVCPPTIAKHLGEVRYLLEETAQASEEQSSRFETLVNELLTGPNISDVELMDLADMSRPYDWWKVDLDLDPDAHWELQTKTFQPSSVQVVHSVQYDAWSRSLSGLVRINVAVEEQYARQNQWGDTPEYRSFFYTAWIQGEVILFEEQEPTLDAIELTEADFGLDQSSLHSQAF